MSEENKSHIVQDDEIDLVELAKTIWSGRKFIAKVTGVFIILGLVIAFTSPVEYEASCKLLPESTEGSMPNLGGLGGLAGLAGIDIGGMAGGGGTLSPQLYPEIVNSLPFILDVMNDTIYFESIDLRTTSFDYFENIAKPSLFGYVLKYTIGLPGVLKSALTIEKLPEDQSNTQEFYRLSKKEWKIIEKFKDRIALSIEEETGLIAIKVEMPDPYAAAQVAKKIEQEVTKAVIQYKTNKAKDNLQFVTESFKDAKAEFESQQLRMARVTDRNMNVSSATAQIELRRIENEYNVAFEVYKGLASQVEQAKIKLKEETPVFTIFEPLRIPEDKSSPNRIMIVILCCLIGVFTGITVSMAKYLFPTH
ncbi:G-rich domain on putative tyrosine kinase [Reichenbachiella faecimaris]|uniref:G-rich domain on putative tyrosine kinase n=1 Tax=Reichenbachiella faecimaris TaxID=692418 RepID=A0A1W2GCW4_REIFA|nr:Wzz/FepE/Etk N-terminal domain-containing protein [Reichenbachiella faecimaris]SMD34322.1 G-rich domain on putative tyrosine kinase [Reichenbachiella faecimaris]